MTDRTCTINGCDNALVAKGLCRKHYQRQHTRGTVAPRVEPTDAERFMAQVDKQQNDCWHWTGHIGESGYGQFRLGGKYPRAHRAAYKLFIGPIPDGLQVDHDCHNQDLNCNDGPDCPHRRCVNPAPLVARTALQNIMAGRTPAAKNAAKTHCDHGHEFTAANTYVYPNGRRACRRCMAIHDAERRPSRTSVRKRVPSE